MSGFDENKYRDYHLLPGLMKINMETTEGWFFQRVYLYIWAIASHELSNRSIRVHNSQFIDSSWQFMSFEIRFFFFESQNVISDKPPPPKSVLIIFKIALCLKDLNGFMWQSLEIFNVFNALILKQIFWKTKAFSKKLDYHVLIEGTNISIQNRPVRRQRLDK